MDLEKLRHPQVEIVKTSVGSKMSTVNLVDWGVDTLAESTKELLLSTDEEVLWRPEGRRNKPESRTASSFSVTKDSLDKKNKRQTRGRFEYKEVNHAIRKGTRAARQN